MNEQQNPITHTGKVKTIIYRKDEYMVAVLKTDTEEIKFTGNMYGIEKNDEITLKGKMINHPTYGEQLQVEEWERPIPKTKEQVVSFLSSGLIKGIGKARAKDIADKLGDNAIEIIKKDGVKALDGIKGIGKKTAENIVQGINDTYEVQEIIRKLSHYGITANMALKLYKNYQQETLPTVQKNPYVLTELDGIGFITADSIARRMGILPTSGYRINAGIDYVLNKICNEKGHSFVEEHELVEHTLLALNTNIDPMHHVYEDELRQSMYALEGKKIVIENNMVYPKYYFKFEDELARKLSIMRGSRDGGAMPSLDKHIINYQKEHGIILAEKQREAVKRLLNEQLLILTGGPGTGKTTVVKAMIDIYKKINKKATIRLAAPTGRASRKLEESTGYEAMTIHRMLGYRQGDLPEYNENNRLEGDLIVVDEMSMVDIQLAYRLVIALEKDAKILFVGDIDQLPSVSPGNVLSDLISSGIPTVKLTEIFRQAEESQIVTNAHRINKGKTLLIDEDKNDFYFIKKENVDHISQLIILSAIRFVDLGYSLEDILVLSPMRKGSAGITFLNEKLRDSLNPKTSFKKEIMLGKRFFREGDKVMQNVNNGEKGVNNGELGIVKNITKELDKDNDRMIDIVICDFDGREIKYTRDELIQIELGYALTIHKSQGGEAKVVIMPITTSHYIMLARNLYYTGITRGKEKVVLIGTDKAMNIAIKNDKISKRNSQLDKRIIAYRNDILKYDTNIKEHSQ